MRPQDYIITRPQLIAVIASMMDDGVLTDGTGDTPDPVRLVAEIMYRRDNFDAQLVRNAQERKDDAGDQAAEDPSDAGSAGS